MAEMDSNASSRKKGPKLFDGQSSNGLGDDRISSLPDSIIHHILSFLPTVQVGRTCVLSTRWRYFWRSTPSLYFTDDGIKVTLMDLMDYKVKHKRFIDFVGRVFTLHDNASNINKFRLEHRRGGGSSFCGTSHFKTWMSTLPRHRLVELILNTKGGGGISLPHLLDQCESLSLLKVIMHCVIRFPASICFSKLRLLHLESVTFTSEELSREVSFHFPLLQEFELQHCHWLKIRTVNIYAPLLRKLTLLDSKGVSSPLETEIKVDAKSLISLFIPGTVFLYEYSLCCPASIVNASLKVDRRSFDVVSGSQRLQNCVTSIYNVKNFELDIITIEALSNAGILTQMQHFPNLINMKVTNVGDGFNGPHLIKLLSCMPNVESLLIDVDDDGYSEYDDETQSGWPQEMVPHGFLSKLKSVEISRLNGSEKELCLITYLLPRTLEKMTINISFNLKGRPEVQNAFMKSLLMLPRGSPGTSVEIR